VLGGSDREADREVGLPDSGRAQDTMLISASSRLSTRGTRS
jgi:hypothetical protein